MTTTRRSAKQINNDLREARLHRLQPDTTNPVKASDLRRFLEEEIWPTIPEDQRYRRMSRDELADILGYGSEGCPSP